MGMLQFLTLAAILVVAVNSHCVNDGMINRYVSVEQQIKYMEKYKRTCTMSTAMTKLVESIHEYSEDLVKAFHGVYDLYNKRYWKQHDGHCYLLAKQRSSWDDAKIRCQKMNSTLVTIETRKENRWLERVAKKAGSDYYWTGLVAKKDHQFKWHITGRKPSFRNFAKDYPRPYPHRCVYLYNGLWYNASCTSAKYFICESQSC